MYAIRSYYAHKCPAIVVGQIGNSRRNQPDDFWRDFIVIIFLLCFIGKSSVARLITRFYEFQGGQLLIDGRDIRRLNLDDYRRHIGLVPQEPFLFTGTVRDNIRYGRPDASDREVRDAAMHIGRGDWLEGSYNFV